MLEVLGKALRDVPDHLLVRPKVAAKAPDAPQRAVFLTEAGHAFDYATRAPRKVFDEGPHGTQGVKEKAQ